MKHVAIGLGTCGISAGGEKVFAAFQDELRAHPDSFVLTETGCIGMCYREVLVEISNGNGTRRLYGEVTPERVSRIVENEILKDSPIDEWLVSGEDANRDFSKIRCASFCATAAGSIPAPSTIISRTAGTSP